MNIGLYFLIFVSKVIENALGTLRLIVVANGKKLLGAILQFIIALVWVAVTGVVVIDVMKDPLKIIFFALGSFVGSYVGSIIEERIALGDSMLMGIVDFEYGDDLAAIIRKEGFAVTVLEGKGKEKSRTVLMIMVPRKVRNQIAHMIKNMDHHAMIVSEKAVSIHGGYIKK